MQPHSLTIETEEGGHVVASSAARVRVIAVITDSDTTEGSGGDGRATGMDLWRVKYQPLIGQIVSV